MRLAVADPGRAPRRDGRMCGGWQDERVTSSRSQGDHPPRALLRDEVTERIKRYILDNRLRPGDPLPTEGELGAALGASRSSVREAVKILGALDIVEVRHGHGTYVGRLSLSALVEGLTFRGLLSPEDDFQVLLDLTDVRELFERGMAGRLVAALDPRHLDTLDALVAEMDDNRGQRDGFVRADREFHGLLVEPLGNRLIHQLSVAFWDVYAVVAPRLKAATATDEQRTIADHRAMIAAARDGDEAAFVAAVTAHYAPVRERVTAARPRRAAAKSG